jgi:purine-binding chemotaxis protein CheW
MSQAQTDAQVLEFELGKETYCVDIDFVAEIVDTAELTPIPNAPEYVEGVMDLRGRTTSIVNPKRVFDIDGNGDGKRIVVFDPEATNNGGATGWLVDEVYQVVRLSTDDVDEPPVESDEAVRGIVKRAGSFVIWVSPDTVDGD